ncbi:MAG: ABC transporter permease [Bacillota bacterium]
MLIVTPADRKPWQVALIYAGAIGLALLLSTAFLALAGKDPVKVLATMFGGAFGTKYGLSETLVRSVPLVLAGLGIALAARMQLWNVGAEGQLYMGAFAASGIALSLGEQLPAPVLLPLMAVAGIVAGGLWGLLPGLARAYWSTNETITTLLLNYVAINWVSYLVYGPWKDPKGFNFPLTATFHINAWMPTLWGRVHSGLIVAILAAVLLYLVLGWTRWGFEIKVVGDSPRAAQYARISITRNILLVMFTAGALAGLAGMMEVSGLIHRLQHNISPGYGYTAIIVAYLARRHPLAILPVAFLFGGLQAGGYSVQTMGVPLASAYMIQGALLFTVLAAEMLTRNQIRLHWRKEAA